MAEETVTVEVTLPRVVAELLAVLDRDVTHVQRDPAPPGSPFPSHARTAKTLGERCIRVLMQLADHAQQGVHQNGGWERQWINQAFGDGWLERTEPGDPNDRTDDVELSQRMYRRPKRS
jgi:hypothetical protein